MGYRETKYKICTFVTTLMTTVIAANLKVGENRESMYTSVHTSVCIQTKRDTYYKISDQYLQVKLSKYYLTFRSNNRLFSVVTSLVLSHKYF